MPTIRCPKCVASDTHCVTAAVTWKDGRRFDRRECSCGTWWHHDNEHPEWNPRPSLDEPGSFYMTSSGDDDPNAHLRPVLQRDVRVRTVQIGNRYKLVTYRIDESDSSD